MEAKQSNSAEQKKSIDNSIEKSPNSSKTLLPANRQDSSKLSASKAADVAVVPVDENSPNMRILCMFMLNAWRKRGQELGKLKYKHDELLQTYMQTQMEVEKSRDCLLRQRKQNEALDAQIRNSNLALNNKQVTFDSLTTSFISAKTELEVAAYELQVKERDFNSMTAQNQDLRKSLDEVRSETVNVKTCLDVQRRKCEILAHERDCFLTTVAELQGYAREREAEMRAQIENKNFELERVDSQIECIQTQIETLASHSFISFRRHCDRIEQYEALLKQLNERIIQLDQTNANGYINRTKNFLKNSPYLRCVLDETTKGFAYLLLPIIPFHSWFAKA